MDGQEKIHIRTIEIANVKKIIFKRVSEATTSQEEMADDWDC